jgi:hypothetical protein
MNARLTSLFAVAVLAIVVVAGCGDESGEATAGPEELSQAAYLSKANAECRKQRVGLRKEIADFFESRRGKGKPPSLLYAELARYVVLPVIETEMEAVRALGPAPGPPSEALTVSRLLYYEETALNELALADRVSSRQAIARRFNWSGKQLKEYGLDSCANGVAAGATAALQSR